MPGIPTITFGATTGRAVVFQEECEGYFVVDLDDVGDAATVSVDPLPIDAADVAAGRVDWSRFEDVPVEPLAENDMVFLSTCMDVVHRFD